MLVIWEERCEHIIDKTGRENAITAGRMNERLSPFNKPWVHRTARKTDGSREHLWTVDGLTTRRADGLTRERPWRAAEWFWRASVTCCRNNHRQYVTDS